MTNLSSLSPNPRSPTCGRCTKRDAGISSQLAIVSASSMRTSLTESPPAGSSPPSQVPYSHSKPLSPQAPPHKAPGGRGTMYWRNKISATPQTSLCCTVDIGKGASRNSVLPQPQKNKMTAEAEVMFIGVKEHVMTTNECLLGRRVQGIVPNTPRDSFLNVEIAGSSRIICWACLHHHRPGEERSQFRHLFCFFVLLLF